MLKIFRNSKSDKLADRVVYRVKGMNCDACAKMIELDLEDAGYKATCNYANSLLEVHEADPNKDGERIKSILEKSGYQIARLEK